MMTMIVVGVGKKMLGRLRPHFLQLCKPNYHQFNCTDGYITNYVCTSGDVKAIAEARYFTYSAFNVGCIGQYFTKNVKNVECKASMTI